MKLPRYHISYQDAHEALARFCICYLTLYLKYLHKSDENTALLRIMRTIEGRSREWSHLSENSPAVFSMSLELLGYVFTDGFNHLAHLGSANRVVLNDMMALQMDIQRYPDAWEMIYQMSRDRKPPTPWPAEKHDFMFYVLIAFSSSSLFLAFLRRCHNVLKLRYQTNPLIYAAHFGKAHHAEMLLSRGAKVNERGLVIDASCQALPLEIAVARRNDSLVDLFLSAGSMVPKRLFTLSTYYNKFPVRIVRMLLETDQFVEWAVDPGNKLPSPLRILEQGPALAYEADIVFIIRKLVQVGVDHAEQDAAQRTALDFAILGGYRAVTVYLMLIGTPLGSSNFTSSARRITPSERASMVRLIVYAGVNVRVCGTGDTTLHLVIKFLEQEECLEAAKILVCAGCKPFVYNQARKTPLHLALEQEYSSVADYLLSQQRPASPDALSAVVESGCPTTWIMDTIRALINGGADIHGVTAYGDGLLHRAVMLLDENLGLEMAKLLVDAGCSPFEHSVQGKTPLHFALDRKSPLLADYLLSTAKLLPTPDDLFSILRSAFPAVWRAQTTGSLVGQGASASGLLADGSTLLHASVLSLNETDVMEVARLLVGAGCDPFKRNVQGKTAFDLVLDRKYSLLADYLLATAKLPPPDTLFAILRSAFPTVWRVQSIRSLVGKGVDVCGLSADGHTLLHATILIFDEGQALDVAQLLVSAGCDPFKSNAQGKTSLDLALDLYSSLLADYLLSTAKLTPPDALLSILRSALPAVWRAHTICSLIEQGADASRLSTDGNTLLHTTVLSLDDLHGLGVAKLLVGAGYDPFKYNMQGRTPLHIALDRNLFLLADYLSLSTGRSPPPDVLFAILRSELPATWRAQTVSSLVYKGTDLRRPSADRHTLLHIIVLSLDERQALEVAKLLVGAGYNPFKRNLQGKTLLDLALDIKFHLLADLLLSTGRSPPSDVLFAVLCSKLPAVWKAQTICSLVGKGVDACGLSADGNTLLHITLLSLVEPHARQIAKILVGAGCDPSARNRQGKTALHIAAEKASFDVMDYMLSLDHSPLPDDILFSALKPCFQFHRHVDMLRILITKGANTRLVAVDGNTLLHAAISISWTFPILDMRTIVSKILVDGGCDAFAPNSRGNTPLHLAAANGLPANILTCVFDKDVPWTSWETMLQLLILKGANVHVRAADGGTLLHMAIKNVPRSTDGVNFLVIIQTLVVSGCDPSQCDADGHPPIYFAITNDHVQVVKYLLPRTVPLPRSLQDAANLAPEHVRGELTQVLEVQESVLPAKGKTSLARRITSRLRFR
ncbi:ankyrin [Imleria badia]|nr:ankyrin [Imleria badia]